MCPTLLVGKSLREVAQELGHFIVAMILIEGRFVNRGVVSGLVGNR